MESYSHYTTVWLTNNGVVEISICHNPNSTPDNGEYLKFTDISLGNPFDEDWETFVQNKKVFGSWTKPTDKTLTANISNFTNIPHDSDFEKDTNSNNDTNMSYMLSPLNVLRVDVKQTAITNFNQYLAKWTYWINGWKWRMIAKNFNLRDDEFTITLARSSTIE